MANRSLSGKIARANGEFFERLVMFHARRLGFHIEKIPSGARWIGPNRVMPVKTPFDFIAAKNKKTIIFDAKCINKDSFSKSEIKLHQAMSLMRFESIGIVAGYLIYFVPVNRVCFYFASELLNLKSRQSLKSDNGIFLGGNDDFDLSLVKFADDSML